MGHDITQPEVAIEYWNDRLKRQGRDYVSRGGKTSPRQVQRLDPNIVNALDNSRFIRGLDYGCGWGRFIHHLATRCDHVLGVDLVDNFMPKKKRPRNVKFAVVGHPTRIPLDDSSVNIVFLITVLQHITGDTWFDEVTREIRRVMAPNARLLIVDDITATAGHVRPRGENIIVSALGIVDYERRVIKIDKKAKHQFIYGRTD